MTINIYEINFMWLEMLLMLWFGEQFKMSVHNILG